MAEIPNVSVIIPLYNREKYIGECLESVLAQTMKNFEIIVVDDCSTDNSCAIVEKFIKTHGGGGGKIKLVRSEKNSGNPGLPSNLGLEVSRGKYIFFMDNDDVMTKNALKEMYTLAEKFQADVVRCTRFYHSDGVGENFLKEKYIVSIADIEKPVFVSEDLSVRLNEWANGIFSSVNSPPWYNLLRRDFLTCNKIKFDNITRADDLWTFKIVCLAKKILMIPNICYIKRDNTGENLTTKGRTVDKLINYWFGRSVRGFKILDEFTAKIESFKNNPETRYRVLNTWLNGDLSIALRACAESKLSPGTICEIFKTEFKEYFGEQNALMSVLVTNNITTMYNLMMANQKIAELTAKK